jgi:transposase-like protein
MGRIARVEGGVKGKKRVLKPGPVLTREEYEGEPVSVRLEMIRALIPLGLMHLEEELQGEVTAWAGARYSREGGVPGLARYGSNPGSVRVGGQRVGMRIPRVRDVWADREVPLRTLEGLRGKGEVNEGLFKKVLYGLSCRRYEEAAEAIPGAIGLSASTVSRAFIQASAQKLQEFQQRRLERYDIVTIFLDGKTFGEDLLVIALGVTIQGEKVFLGFVQTGTENEASLSRFLGTLLERGLSVDRGVLVVIDGGKGLRKAVGQVWGGRALVQRCQWHKRENVVKHLAQSEQGRWRRRLQEAYERPTYPEAKSALTQAHAELAERNLSAAASLEEGLEETLTLHRLGVFGLLGPSLKTTNCLESVMSQVEQLCAKVDCWKNSMQKHRWLATSLLAMEPRLNRIRGANHLSELRIALARELKIADKAQVA